VVGNIIKTPYNFIITGLLETKIVRGNLGFILIKKKLIMGGTKYMTQIKKTLSIFMVTLFVMVWILGNTTSKASSIIVPTITYVGIGHSPMVIGDTEKFTVTSNYTGDVQYRAFLFNGKAWKELTSGYSPAINGKSPYVLPETSAFQLGKYKLSVWIKRAGTSGIISNTNGGYDSFYVVALNCVNKDDSNRVYANGVAKFDVNGLTFKFNGIQGIAGVKGPYKYRLHIYNPITNKWTNRATEYTEAPAYTFEKPGTYMVIVHANTINSTTWGKYTKEDKTVANKGSTYGTYEAWKTIMVTVNDYLTVFDTSVKESTLGAMVNVTMTAQGVKEFPSATKYQIFNDTSAISDPATLGTATIVLPAKTSGDTVNVKLFDASYTEVKTIEAILGQAGTIKVIPIVKATVKPAIFGTLVNVTSTKVGAVKYQLFNGETAISAPTILGTATTIFPGKVAGDLVAVKLLNVSDEVISTTEAVLVTPE
jgi:hypothetical protein